MKDLPQIIALVGNAGAGKSTVAEYLVKVHSYRVVKFAGPLKTMLRAIGLTDDEIEGSKKEQPCGMLCGKTPRHAMVTLGTEWARDHIGEDFWAALWRDQVAGVIWHGGRVVVDDCRFENELASVESMNGIAWHITRPDHAGSSIPGHRSEGALAAHYEFMREMVNDSDITALHLKVFDALKDELNTEESRAKAARDAKAGVVHE
jgi:hypothetical protein